MMDESKRKVDLNIRREREKGRQRDRKQRKKCDAQRE